MPPRWIAHTGRPMDVAMWRLVATAVCCAFLLSAWPSLASSQEFAVPDVSSDAVSTEEQIRLRIYCDSGGPSVKWSGVVSLAGGKLLDVQPWGSEPDAAVVARQLGDQVVVSPVSKRRIAAFDVTAAGPRSATLKIQVSASDGQPAVAEMSLADLAVRPSRVALGEAGAIQVFRAIDDRLRLKADRQQLLFSPGDDFRFSLFADLPSAKPGSPIDSQVRVLQGRSGPETTGGQVQRATMPVTGSAKSDFQVTLPREEGVYTLQISARRPAGLMRGWTKSAGKPLAERLVQMVVWDPKKATRLSEQERLVVEIDPTSKHWWNHIPEWKWMRKVPWLRTGPLGDAPSEIVSTDEGRLIRLAPAVSGDQIAWQAYPLPIQQPGMPHVIEIEVPDDAPQELSLTLFDRDALGRAASLGDSLTARSGAIRGPKGKRTVARKLFWPKTDSPMLVVSNHSRAGNAHYGRVRVYSLDREPMANAPLQQPDQRIVAHCVTSAQLAKTMQATHRASRDQRYVLDDWQTCYETAVRVADYTQAAGYNAAVVTAVSGEGSLCPGGLLGTHTGIDREALASGMADLPRKDLLEILLREFDRRGLRLVLNVRLESALAGVEAQRAGQQGPAIDCLDVSGKPLKELGQRYSPLNETVRREVLAVVDEVAKRGASHPSFAGIAVDLSPHSHACLPGDLACADPGVISQFQQANQLPWPEGVPRNDETLRRAIVSVWNEPWRRWRIQRMTSLYSEMARRVVQADPNAKLWLLAGHLLDDQLGRGAIRPRLEGRPTLDTLLAERGISRERLSVLPNLTFVAPRLNEQPSSLMGAAFPLALDELYWQEPAEQAVPQAAHLLGAWRQASLMGFKASSPFGAERTFTATSLTHATVGTQKTASLLNAVFGSSGRDVLSEGDANPLAIDPDLKLLRESLHKLRPFSRNKTTSQQPLTLQVLNNADATYLLAGNQSPWALKAAVTLDAPRRCSIQRLSADIGALQLGVGKHALPLDMKPFELQVYRIDCQKVEATGVRTESQPEAKLALTEEVERLVSRDLSARRPFEGCRNLSFEELTTAELPVAWNWDQATPAGGVTINRQSPADGAAALQITAGPNAVRVASDAFKPPATRQLVMTFHIRSERLAPNGLLAIHFKNESGQDAYTTIPASALKADQQWRQFVFAENLPIMSDGPMQIVFEAQNMSVTLDKVELDELTFPMNFALPAASARQRLELVKIVQSARIALDEGRTTDCQNILDGYWPRFLSEFTPLVERPPIAKAPQGAENQEKDEESPPEVSSRWKSYLPRFLRF